ncbi:hypothetical protein SAMN06297251_10627 [Fulvimarina manganoxydans]|uniref:Uncharacterized protein n=1 Tax=Fulvimarina manganoxydans TaxID=937218 RepID=A0A1W2BBH0_9HYPH|nr:hypothetical protein [Fulvimarina manganoxydans]SMC70256.1 hypothetical protein SAMN06297251_10627 [Fulvimarina manganoxydans]
MAVRPVETVQDVFAAFGIEDNDEDAPVFGPAKTERHQFVPADGGNGHSEPPTSEESVPDEPEPEPDTSGARRLSRAYEVRGIKFDRLMISAPRGEDYWEIGELSEWSFTAEGTPFRLTREHAVRAYAERCISVDRRVPAAEVLNSLNLADARMVRRAIMGFFEEPEGSSA